MIDWAEIKRLRADEDETQLVAAQKILEGEITRFRAESANRNDTYRTRITALLYDDLSETLKLLGDEAGATDAARKAQRANPNRPK